MEVNKKNINLRINKQVQKFINKYDGWKVVTTPELYQQLDGMADPVYLAKPYNNLTNLLVIFNCSINMRRYGVLVGWSDRMPIPEPNIQNMIRAGFWLDYYKQEHPTDEFEESYMHNCVEKLHGRFTRNRYPVRRYEEDDDFETMFQDIETFGVKYWEIMLERRFNIVDDNLKL